MLEKEPGNPIINRLRIICLYEADYNLYLKIMWAHRLVNIVEKEKLFDKSQSGDRPCRTSNDVTCAKAERQQITTTCIEAIIDIFNRRRSGKGLTKSLEVTLNFWRNHPNQHQPFTQVHRELREAWNEQLLIGWNNFF
jgi:hypothetical protein